MTLFVVGLVLFLGIHSVGIVAPAWRDAQVARRGEAAWKGLYSVVSVLGFVLLVVGYGLARQTSPVLYAPPTVLRHFALLLMVPVFPLLLAVYLPGRISSAVKHPMLTAVKLWAVAHLLANGTLVDVILFGAFLAWAVLDRIAVKRRSLPRVVPGAPRSAANDVIVLVGGLAIYVALVLWVHLWLIGVSPLALR